jgi:hypothetical protein
MAKAPTQTVRLQRLTVNKKTSQGFRNIKLSSMNKRTKANLKKYRGQGR